MKRRNDESFSDYKLRRARVNRLVKAYRQGWMLWDSKKEGTISSISILNRSIAAQKSMEGFFNGEDF